MPSTVVQPPAARPRRLSPGRAALCLLLLAVIAAGGWLVRAERIREGLRIAVLQGDVANVRHFLDLGADPNAHIPAKAEARRGTLWETLLSVVRINAKPNPDARTLLMAAAEKGPAESVELLLKKGADPNVHTPKGETALLIASARSDGAVVTALVQAGADVRATDAGGRQPVHLAAAAGVSPSLRALLDAGADLKAEDSSRWTPIEHAALNERPDAVAELMRRGADVNRLVNAGLQPITWAAAWGRADLLRDIWKKQSAAERRRVGGIALAAAASCRDEATVRFLLQQGVPAHSSGSVAVPPLIAVFQPLLAGILRTGMVLGNQSGADALARLTGPRPSVQPDPTRVIELLLRSGAKVDARNTTGETALHRACREAGAVGVRSARLLLDRRASVTARDRYAKTPLHSAAVHNRATAKLLLSRGADAKAVDNRGQNPLMLTRFSDVARALLARGVNKNARDRQGRTALMLNRSPEVVPLLIARGAEIEARDHQGRTALMHAAQRGDRFAVVLLRWQNANVSARDNRGRTAADLARLTPAGRPGLEALAATREETSLIVQETTRTILAGAARP
jgi:ankyrin repeat protein